MARDPSSCTAPGESNAWLTRNGGAPGPVDTTQGALLPAHRRRPGQYFLPVSIPARRGSCRWAHPLRHAGRIPQLHAQRRHSRNQRPSLTLAREAAFFGVRNGADAATRVEFRPSGRSPGHRLCRAAGPLAGAALGRRRRHKEQLARLLGGGDTPALLFTASRHRLRQRPSTPAAPTGRAPVQRLGRGQGAPSDRQFFTADDIGTDREPDGAGC